MHSIRLVAALAVAAAVVAGCDGGSDPDPAPPRASAAAGSGSTSPGAGSGAPGSDAPAGNLVALPAAEILARARAAVRSAPSVHVTGAAIAENFPVELDVRIKGEAGGTGQIVLRGEDIELLRIGRTGYVRAGEGFWRGIGDVATAKRLSGKYVRGSPRDPVTSSLLRFLDQNTLALGVFDAKSKVTKGTPKSIRNIRALPLTAPLPASGSGGGTLYVALSGPPYPLQYNSPEEAKTPSSLDLVYGEPVRLRRPPANLIVDAPAPRQR